MIAAKKRNKKPGLLLYAQALLREIGDNHGMQEENSGQVYCAD